GGRRVDLGLARGAAYDAAEPHHVAHGRDQRSGGAARHRLRRHDRRSPYSARAAASLSGPDYNVPAGLHRDFARSHHRAAGFRRQRYHSSHGAARSAHGCVDGASTMITGTLSRYFGWRFLSAVLAVVAGTLVFTRLVHFFRLFAPSP